MNYCKEIASFRYNRTDTQENSQRPTVLTRPVQAQIRIKKSQWKEEGGGHKFLSLTKKWFAVCTYCEKESQFLHSVTVTQPHSRAGPVSRTTWSKQNRFSDFLVRLVGLVLFVRLFVVGGVCFFTSVCKHFISFFGVILFYFLFYGCLTFLLRKRNNMILGWWRYWNIIEGVRRGEKAYDKSPLYENL